MVNGRTAQRSGLSIMWTVADAAVTLCLSGEVDLSNADLLESSILEALDAGATSVTVDLAGLRMLDSSGVGALAHGQAAASRRDLALRVVGASGIVERVLRIIGVYDTLTGDRQLAHDNADSSDAAGELR